MGIFNLHEGHAITIRKASAVYHAKRLTTAQYFAFRHISETIEAVPPVDTEDSAVILEKCRSKLRKLIDRNFQEIEARQELREYPLPELLDLAEYLIAGPDSEEIGNQLANVDPENAAFTIMSTFPGYKLYQIASMPASEFLVIHQLAVKVTA